MWVKKETASLIFHAITIYIPAANMPLKCQFFCYICKLFQLFHDHNPTKYVPTRNMPLKCHMPKLLNVHQWGKYVNIHATYEVDPINDMARNLSTHDDANITWLSTTMLMIPQPDCIDWFGHLAISAKNLSLQAQHTLPKCKLSKFSLFKTTKLPQCENFPNQSLQDCYILWK